jgi:hypothetical protein
MKNLERNVRSLAAEVLRSPQYLRELEQHILRGEAPDVELWRHAINHGPISKAARDGIRWNRESKVWIGRVYLDDKLVYEKAHRRLADSIAELESEVKRVKRLARRVKS